MPNRPKLYLIKNTNVPYLPDAVFPPWEAFLDDVTGGNQRIRGFLQVVFGYASTGSTKEEKLFILHGAGGTGKSTLLEAVSGAIGEYHVAASFSPFLKKDRVTELMPGATAKPAPQPSPACVGPSRGLRPG